MLFGPFHEKGGSLRDEVNRRREVCNQRPVTRTLSWIFAPFALVVVGCAGAAPAPGGVHETPILLQNAVEEPCALAFANVLIDEQPTARVTVAPPGEEAVVLDRLLLGPGNHVVGVAASAACPGGPEGKTVLHVTQPIYLSKGATRVVVTIARDKEASSGLTAKVVVEGGAAFQPGADGGEVSCAGRVPTDDAICRTEAELRRALNERDAVRSACVNDKLRVMRWLSETSQTDATPRVLALADEAGRCVGLDVYRADGMRVLPASPSAAAPAF